ncbi:OmpA family protein [Acinetobacter radioresistens]|uniref:OmpA family protein n=1 Tax=Acinetobacter radioresistens TaxID=40216 RepID=UPI00200448E8|nr:OmpA family protein [Acinetobacter radioresistens]MCK4083684.1 OmpA family protein [Acinetobacter radioresistens]
MTGCMSKPVEPPVLNVVTIPQPTFNVLKVYAPSEVVRVPTIEQTVVCNGCDEVSAGMNQGDDVIWIRLVEAKREETIIDARHFDFDKAILKGDLSKLRLIAQRLLDNPEIDAEIVGHTDSIGSVKYNQKLGQRRANAVKNWLVKQGVSPNRIITSSKGELQPIASNKTKAGRAQNRRAVVVINVAE